MKKSSLTLIGMVMMVVFALSVNTDNQDELGIKNAKALADKIVIIECDGSISEECNLLINEKEGILLRGKGVLSEKTVDTNTTTITETTKVIAY